MILDMKTIMLTYVIVYIICAFIMAFVWYQNKKYFAGTSFWLADMILQACGGLLIFMRGLVPDFISVIIANTMLLAGLITIYIGLERFLGKRSSQIHNYVLLTAFVAIATYFTLVMPNLEARNINFSVMTMVFSLQCYWLLMHRVSPDIRRMTVGVAAVFGSFALISAIRVTRYIFVPLQSNDFFKSGTFETLLIMLYTVLAIGLVCALILMVNRRLLTEVQAGVEQTQRERDRAKKYFDIAGTMLLVLDTDGKVSAINKKGCEIVECDEQDIIGKDWFHIFTPKRMRDGARSIFKKIMKGEIEPFEYVEGFAVLSKSGKEKLVSWHNSIIKNERGKTIGILRSGEDVTELRRMEGERKEIEQRAQVASRMASIGELASGVAHEINNPLTGIIGYAQYLVERKDIPEDIRNDIKVIDDSAHRVSSIVRRLSTFARHTKPQRTDVDINDLITGVLEMSEYDLGASNIKVTTDFDPDLPITAADPGQLQQVFVNLIRNAEREMKLAHGKGKLLIKTEQVNSTIRISFKDNGPGIPKNNLDKIFEPFFTTREVGEGAGLGLSMCYGIVKDHGGSIWAESEPGKGATFIVELPVTTRTTRLSKSRSSTKKEQQQIPN